MRKLINDILDFLEETWLYFLIVTMLVVMLILAHGCENRGDRIYKLEKRIEKLEQK